jgi:hypothetical protein
MGRAVNALFFLFTAAYCLLTFSPFAYEQFIQPHVIAWLANFVLLYADFYWLALSVTALTLVPCLRSPRLRAWSWGYLAAATVAGILATIRPVLPAGNGPVRSVTVALLALVPLLVLGGLDHAAAGLSAGTARDATAPLRPPLQITCFWTAAFTWAMYAMFAAIRLRSAGGLSDSSAGALAFGIVVSAVAHLTAFALLFVALTAVARTAEWLHLPPAAGYWLRLALWCLAAAVLLQRVVLTPIAIDGGIGYVLAAGTGAALVVSIAGMVQLHRGTPSRLAAAATLAVLPAAAFVALVVLTPFDWGFMLQKLSAVAAGTVAFGAIRALLATKSPAAAPRRQVTLPIAAMIAFAITAAAAPRLSAWADDPRLDPGFALDAYSAGDPSFRLLRQFLDRSRTLQRDAEFFSFLRANTSIQAQLRPVSVDFVRRFAVPGAAQPPDIFLFLIDSLRRDYVAPYNPAVTFTPALAAFARESYVFERAFTRYGGTGLAVPSIWAGALQIHKQYVTPFAPTNALAKLLDAAGYRRAVGFDHITDQLFGFPSGSTILDRAVPEMMHTFCGTIAQLQADISAHGGDRRPLFAHTRPLDLHIGNTRFASVPQGESYPGFFAPYAARVHRIDDCFGDFVAFLKRTGRYDNSIVIVLSDHGDSLGEGLRWGHGYTVFPEVIRIPLMVRLPPGMRDRTTADTARVSFATDVTPTLYELLGQHPERPRIAAGTPLIVESGHLLDDRSAESFLVASSYGAVYGLVRQNGRRLYVADAIEGHDYLFDLGASGHDARVGLGDAERLASRAIIREQLADLAAWYGDR